MTKRAAVAVLGASLGLAGSSVWASAPTAPTGLRGDTSVPGQVTLSWDASVGADSYNVYRSVDWPLERGTSGPFPPWVVAGGATLVTSGAQPPYTDSGLPPLVRQFYVVTAVNGEGESPLPFVTRPVIEVRVTAPPDASVFGFADLHSHQFSNEAFGGQFLWGKPFGPPSQALGLCGGIGIGIHGLGGLSDLIGNSLRSGFPLSGHLVGGDDQFNGWPYWNDYTHQQMHADWLKRAYDGGLRLLVVHAVNNRLLCQIKGPLPGYGCEDMPAVDRQLAAAKEMERYIDTQSGGPGQGWYRIAYSATEARHIINSGKLAVVLGIEVDALFGCGINGPCDDPQVPLEAREQYVADQLNDYYGQGVRHIFPVHLFDNAFGGAAMYEEFFNYGNKVLTGGASGHFFDPTACPEGRGYQYKLENPTFLFSLLGFLSGLGAPTATSNPADCNSRGLTSLGGTLVRQVMRKHMVLDIDHMSEATTRSVLDMARGQAYPVVAGHTGIIAASSGQKAHEGQKTADQLQRIRDLHGLVAPILRQGSTHDIGFDPGGVPNDCGQSSKSWAQAYLATVDAMGGPGHASVGLGSDFNGMAGEPAPRFGPERCAGDETAPQVDPVSYPFAIEAPPGVPAGGAGHLDRLYYGQHTHNGGSGAAAGYDYNVEGLAHVGLLPDFVADLRSFLPADALQPLFRSAEGYLQVWERAERTQVFPPSVTAATLPADAGSSWQPGDVTVTITAAPHPQGSSNLSIRYSAQGATPLPQAVIQGTMASVTLTNEGATTLIFDAVDHLGSSAPEQTLTVRIDRTPPNITCASPLTGWFAQNVALGCTAGDALSGLADTGDATFNLETTVAPGAETADAATGSRTVADTVGNVAVAGPIGGNHVDRKGPTVDLSVSGTGTYLIHQAATVAFSCTDDGSGIASCVGTPSSGSLDTDTPGVKQVTVDSADQVGNTSSANRSYTVAYGVCPLYDPAKIKKTGSTIPVKLQVCDARTSNLSRPDLVVTATGVRMVSSSTVGVLDDSGEANPDFNFRYDPSLAGYIFNLSTKGLAPGSWQLVFRIAGDPTDHAALFQLR